MLVPSEIQKCVCFIYVEQNGVRRPVGTAFFVAQPWWETAQGSVIPPAVYIVTALHVIAKAEQVSDDRCVYLRINHESGGSVFYRAELHHWVKADQSERAIDVAVLRWQAIGFDEREPNALDFRSIPTTSIGTPELVEAEGIGVGCEVFLPGLFVNHVGTARNVPIVRSGTIASMPDELVSTRLGPMNAYLVEARSVGGLSGSPVFAAMGSHRATPAGIVPRDGRRAWCLIGLMHGHWSAPAEQVDEDSAFGQEMVNMGVAVVATIQDVLDLIPRPAEAVREWSAGL